MIIRRSLIRIALALTLAPVFAQEPPALPPVPQNRDQQRAPEELLPTMEQVRDFGGYKEVTKIYEIKWRDPEEIAVLLSSFASRGKVHSNRAFRTVTVTADPKDTPLIDSLIRTYDVPAHELEFQFFLLRGRKTGTGVKDGVPEDIRRVLEDVSSLTAFKSFELIASPVVRATEGRPLSVDSKSDIFARIEVSPPALVAAGSGPVQIRIDSFRLRCEFPRVAVLAPPESPDKPPERVAEREFQSAGLETSFRLADGETIVVGSSGIRDAESQSGDAVIAVVRAKVLK